MKLPKKLLSSKKIRIVIIIIIDVILISLAMLAAFFLRFDGIIPESHLRLLLPAIILALIVALPVFLIQKLYLLSWSYASLTDLPKIMKATLLATGLFTAILFIFRTHPLYIGFPRSIVLLYGILLFVFVSASRLSKRIYWQLIRGKLISEKRWQNFINQSRPKDIKINTVLVTGGAGYIGSLLVRKLLEKKYRVKVMDKLLFGDDSIKSLGENHNFQLIKGDIQNPGDIKRAVDDVDAVIHLAAIVGDAACAADQETALKTNYLATINLARLCKEKGVNKFIFASTCSTYGIGDEEKLTEGSSLQPVSLYAESKIYAEKELIKMTDGNFMPIIFRFSTIYGLSPRMRFDLVVNLLTVKAFAEKEILIFGGHQWRPFVHVKDVCSAIISCLETPFAKIDGQIFNLGGDKENYLINSIGEIIKKIMPDTKVKIIDDNNDRRTYHVSFEKIKKVFGFEPTKNVEEGIKEICEALKEKRFVDYKDRKYYNYNPKQ
jgi:nucleoside-diphosphate-sugar epimerase